MFSQFLVGRPEEFNDSPCRSFGVDSQVAMTIGITNWLPLIMIYYSVVLNRA